MNIPSLDTIKASFKTAPGYIKEFIKSDDLTKIFTALRTDYKLHLDEAGMLADMLNAVMLELVPLGSFEAMVTEHLPRLTTDERTKLVQGVNEKVFAAVRARALKPASPEVTPAPAPVTPPPQSVKPVAPSAPTPAPTPAPLPAIVEQKLMAPVHETPQTVSVPMPQPAPTPSVPKYETDPYREPLE